MTLEPAKIRELLAEAARRDAVEVHAIATGLPPAGIDLGSPSLKPGELPKAALVVGDGVDAYAAGECSTRATRCRCRWSTRRPWTTSSSRNTPTFKAVPEVSDLTEANRG